MRWNSLASFYASESWARFKAGLLLERGYKCEECGSEFVDGTPIGHHKEELTLENVNDFAISLNPEKIMIVCQKCHNKKHERLLGVYGRKVYLVWGAPRSGKTTLVSEMAKPGDLIVDMDRIWDGLCLGGEELKPDGIKADVFAVRDLLYDRIRMRAGRWQSAWVIAGLPERGERDRTIKRLGEVEVIHVGTNKEECLRRTRYDKRKTGWVEDYFQRYQPDPPTLDNQASPH